MKTFREALLETLESTNISLKSVADGSGVSYEQLKKLKQKDGRSTNVEDALKIAQYFGVSLDEFMMGKVTKDDAEIVDLLFQLEPSERQFLLNAAKAQIAARDSE